jgi:carboxypeptidase C (cathepsin A)
MNRIRISRSFALIAAAGAAWMAMSTILLHAARADEKESRDNKTAAAPSEGDRPSGKFEPFKSESKTSNGTVTVGGQPIAYQAIAGTLIVHPKGWDDVPQDPKTDKPDGGPPPEGESRNPSAEASVFYVAYFKTGGSGARPITFLYNGGPGSSTVWLHMGAFGPRRIVTSTDAHTPAAPYSVVNNASSLLDASDLVFIDAPGTGFSRIAGKDKEKAFFGVDPDAHAFAEFISQFLTKYGRWNSPKYLFGESYGTTRSAVLANILENENSVDLNGVILLSQILSFDTSIDGPQFNPGIDLPYELALPTFAATAFYHHKLPQQPAALEPFLEEVKQYALGDYAQALMAGSRLSEAQKQVVAEKLHQYTGLPVAYLLKANLRVSGGMFEHELQAGDETTTGRLDSRFAGPSLDPLAKDSEYDPQSSAISSAYIAAFNDYVRKDLKFGDGQQYREFADIDHWDFSHKAPGVDGEALQSSTNVMPDLAMAMKTNPNLKVYLNGGYYDLATPFFAADYEMHHLPIPASLNANISYSWYPSGHMVYAHEASLKQLHDNVARFIEQTDNVKR